MINVFIHDLTPRIQYSFKLIFETLLNSKVTFYTKPNDFLNSEGLKINYSDQTELEGLYLLPQGLLQEKGINIHEPKVIDWEGEKALYPVSNSFIPFDVFAATFYLVTRYEEYLPAKRDAHNRYMASESLAVRYGFIEMPLVNRWAIKLAHFIEKEFEGIKFSQSDFTYIPTIDIDNAWAFRNKGLFRTTFSATKDIISGRFSVLKKRLKVLAHIEKDNYDTYDFMLSTFKSFAYQPIFFFLLNEMGKYDRSVSYKNENYRRLILKLSQIGKIGIHPSYASNNNQKLLSIEIKRLKEIAGIKVDRSRQHFLKIELPGTYRSLIKQGIKSDYSMGYASQPGFRASIATPFFFFDLIDDRATKLKITPFQVMDVTLMQYLNKTPAEAVEIIEKLMKETAVVGGTFISLWHNESMSDEGKWAGWQSVYTKMTRTAYEISNGKNN